MTFEEGNDDRSVQAVLEQVLTQLDEIAASQAALATRLDALEGSLGDLAGADISTKLLANEAAIAALQSDLAGLTASSVTWTESETPKTVFDVVSDTIAIQSTLVKDLAQVEGVHSVFADQTNDSIESILHDVTSLEVAVKAPRPCPSGTIVLDSQTCIEKEPEVQAPFFQAVSYCRANDMRLCDFDEMQAFCRPIFQIENPTVATEFIQSPHWTSSVVSPQGEEDEFPTGIAIYRADSNSPGCNRVAIETTPEIGKFSYPFFCCIDR